MSKQIDINKYIGQKFGDITIIRFIEKDKNYNYIFEYECICGRISTTDLSRIKRKKYLCEKSTPCIIYKREIHDPYLGQKFNDIVIIKNIGYSQKHHGFRYQYECICGSIRENTISKIKIQKNICSITICKNRIEIDQKEMIGKKFNDITILRFVHRDKNSNSIYEYICKCGKISQKSTGNIYSRENKCCPRSCVEYYWNQFIGQKFRKLTIVRFIGKGLKDFHSIYEFKCDCGKLFEADISTIFNKKQPLSQCYNCRNVVHSTHKTNIKLYKRWKGMIERCYVKSSPSYKYYGERGIQVCDRWKKSCDNFALDMGDIPFKGAQLDRINPDGDYEPGNVRWVTAKENQNNRRISKKNQKNYRVVKIADLCKKCNYKTKSTKNLNTSLVNVNLNQLTLFEINEPNNIK